MKKLITIEGLSKAWVAQLFDVADQYKAVAERQSSVPPSHWGRGRRMVCLFSEPSTRTLCSFLWAAKALGISILPFYETQSSVQKAESLVDTVLNLEAMGVEGFVVRQGDPVVVQAIADALSKETVLINGGAGAYAHPSQALLDAFTLQQRISNWQTLSVAIVGDIRHSRVARSLVALLSLLGVQDVRLVCPNYFRPDDAVSWSGQWCDTLAEGIDGVDVVYGLRVQKERLSAALAFNDQGYIQAFQLSAKRLAKLCPKAWVMHPGPVNRGVEITDEVADGAKSLILEQVRLGVFVRMAIIESLFLEPWSS